MNLFKKQKQTHRQKFRWLSGKESTSGKGPALSMQ